MNSLDRTPSSTPPPPPTVGNGFTVYSESPPHYRSQLGGVGRRPRNAVPARLARPAIRFPFRRPTYAASLSPYFHARRSLALLALPSTMPPPREALDEARNGSRTARLKVYKKSRLVCKPSSSSSFPLLAAAAATQRRHPVITHARAPKMTRTGRSSFTELVQNLTGRPCTDESRSSRLCTRHDDRYIGQKRGDKSSSFHTTALAGPLL